MYYIYIIYYASDGNSSVQLTIKADVDINIYTMHTQI